MSAPEPTEADTLAGDRRRDLSHLDTPFTVDHSSCEYPEARKEAMKTVQMALDDDLLEDVDRVVNELHTTRSAFARNALRAAIRQHRETLLQEKHRRGYEARPATEEEFGVWEEEQEWGDV